MSFPSESEVGARLIQVRERVEASARRSGREVQSIRIVGVSKGQSAERVRAAVEAGLSDLGANYVQEWERQSGELGTLPIQWHFVGRLQRRKLSKIVGKVDLIHSVSRWEELEDIHRRALSAGLCQDALVQVNIANEPTKSGVNPEETEELVKMAGKLSGVRIRGLMFMPPPEQDPEKTRAWYRKGQRLLVRLQESLKSDATHLNELSMGMSGDFEIAIEEGATIVRVGTSVFGSRPG